MNRREFLCTGCAAACASAPPASAAGDEPDSFVRVSPRDRRYFELSDGSPFIPVGLNMIAPPRVQGEEGESLAAFEAWLRSLSTNGGNYIRVWLSSPFWDVEHEKSGVYDAQRAQRIDRMLEMCRKYRIRVKMTLEHLRSIGEPPVRQAWADKPLHLSANGGPAKSIADFFDGDASRSQFRRKIRWYAERYGDQPIVYGWELWNEINAVRGGDYMAWTEAMLAELHKAFPKNLAMQSLGSFDTARVTDLYRRHSTMPGNDIAQVHRYLDLGASLDVCKGPVDVLAADAVRELAGYKPNRPIILAESGAVEPKHTGPFKLYQADKAGTILHDILFAPFFNGAAGAGQIWHWDAYVAANDLWYHYGRFAEVVKGLDPAAEEFAAHQLHRRRFRIYVLQGIRTTLIWVRDAQNTWESELQNGQPPDALEGLSIDIGKVTDSKRAAVRVYDPWRNTWSAGEIRNGTVRLPAFKRSIVLRIAGARG